MKKNIKPDGHFLGLFSLDLDKLIKDSTGDVRIAAKNLQELLEGYKGNK